MIYRHPSGSKPRFVFGVVVAGTGALQGRASRADRGSCRRRPRRTTTTRLTAYGVVFWVPGRWWYHGLFGGYQRGPRRDGPGDLGTSAGGGTALMGSSASSGSDARAVRPAAATSILFTRCGPPPLAPAAALVQPQVQMIASFAAVQDHSRRTNCQVSSPNPKRRRPHQQCHHSQRCPRWPGPRPRSPRWYPPEKPTMPPPAEVPETPCIMPSATSPPGADDGGKTLDPHAKPAP